MKRIAFYVCIAGLIFSLIMTCRYLVETGRSAAIYNDTQDIYYKGAASLPAKTGQPDLVGQSKPDFTGKKKAIQSKFLDLVNMNKDVVGWVKIPGTAIDYPVVRAGDNQFYLEHSINGEINKAGAIFMDHRNSLAIGDRNIILYGHNMKNGTMFKDLMKYKQKDFFEKNRVISFDNLYEDHQWEIFSAYVTDARSGFIQTAFGTENAFTDFLDEIIKKSIYKTDVELSGTDVVLTLSTCSYEFDDARFVVHARLIK